MTDRVFTKTTRPNRHRPQDALRTLIHQARNLAAGLDRETFNRRPAENAWSVAECLEHLNVSARLYLPVLTDAIDGAKRKPGRRRQPGLTLLGRLIVWGMEPPPRRLSKTKTFERLEPARDLDPEYVLDEFEALHEELIVRMNEAGDLDLKRVKVRSVLDRRLRLSLGDWFAFLAAHGRRHLWQAERALEQVRAGTSEGPG